MEIEISNDDLNIQKNFFFNLLDNLKFTSNQVKLVEGIIKLWLLFKSSNKSLISIFCPDGSYSVFNLTSLDNPFKIYKPYKEKSYEYLVSTKNEYIVLKDLSINLMNNIKLSECIISKDYQLNDFKVKIKSPIKIRARLKLFLKSSYKILGSEKIYSTEYEVEKEVFIEVDRIELKNYVFQKDQKISIERTLYTEILGKYLINESIVLLENFELNYPLYFNGTIEDIKKLTVRDIQELTSNQIHSMSKEHIENFSQELLSYFPKFLIEAYLNKCKAYGIPLPIEYKNIQECKIQALISNENKCSNQQFSLIYDLISNIK